MWRDKGSTAREPYLDLDLCYIHLLRFYHNLKIFKANLGKTDSVKINL